MYNGNPVSIVGSWVYLWRIKIKWDDFFSLHTIYYVIYNKIKKNYKHNSYANEVFYKSITKFFLSDKFILKLRNKKLIPFIYIWSIFIDVLGRYKNKYKN